MRPKPAPRGATSTAYLIVDMRRVLDESVHGRVAQESLRSILERTSPRRDELKDRYLKAKGDARKAALDELLEFEKRHREELSKRRSALRRALEGLASSIVERVAEERGVSLVIERGAALVHDPDADITAEIIRRMDAVRIDAPRSEPTG